MIESARPLKPDEVAQRYSVTTRTVQRWVVQGKFPQPLRVGGATRWPLQTLVAWESQQVQASGKDTQRKCVPVTLASPGE